jgi:uncharacterized protein YpmB
VLIGLWCNESKSFTGRAFNNLKTIKYKKMKKHILTIVIGLAIALTTTTYAAGIISTDPPATNAQEKALEDFTKQAGISVSPNLYTYVTIKQKFNIDS